MEKLKREQCDYYSIFRGNLKRHAERKHLNAFIHKICLRIIIFHLYYSKK